MEELGLFSQDISWLCLDQWEVPRNNVVLNRKLGEGAFGTVFGGEANIGGMWVAAAVKTLKLSSKPDEKVSLLSRLWCFILYYCFILYHCFISFILVKSWLFLMSWRLTLSRLSQLDFLSEAEMMKRFNHENIVKLLGVCTRGEPTLAIMEFMLHGNFLITI